MKRSFSGLAATTRIPARRVAQWQAAYYVLTGIWPLLSRRSFEAVTGQKRDYWLVQTVGGLVAVTGAALATAACDERTLQSPAIRILGVGSALSLATIDFVFVRRRRISPIYLADAAAEVGVVAGWLLPLTSHGRIRAGSPGSG